MTRRTFRVAVLFLMWVTVVAGCGGGGDPALSSANELTAFGFHAADNPALTADVSATISGASITASVPPGVDVTALVAAFATTGTSVTVGGTAQLSGTTAQNFTAPMTYRVTAASGATRDYTVSVTVAPASTAAITAYAFLAAHNTGLGANVAAAINGSSITATVPFGTNATRLVASFATSGPPAETSVTVEGTPQVSDATANDFSHPLTVRATDAHGAARDYTVTVTVAPRAAKAITAYAFRAALNPQLSADIAATIQGTAITATLPFGVSPAALVASFATTGTSVTVAGAPQLSDATANDFTHPVAYTVTAADGSTQVYTVTVIVAARTAKDLTAFAFRSAQNPGLGADVSAVINGTAISATVPSGTNPAALVASFTTSGASVTVGGTPQVSDVTANDFTHPAPYRVTAADGSTRDYTVTVTIAASSAAAITAYVFHAANNPGLGADIPATINGPAISATVPSGTSVSALVATFATTGTRVAVAGTAQTSGATANDFATPILYTVTAGNGATQTYTVTVTVAAPAAKTITAYAFRSARNTGLGADVIATINGTAISATVPSGTSVTQLVASFTTTGARVAVAGTAQTSEVTANNFTSPVVYTVTAADGSTQAYTVTVTVAAPAAKAITAYAFQSVHNPGLGADIPATIDGTSIVATVPSGTNVTALVASFTTTGAGVAVAATAQVSDATANDFTNPVVYTVTAADGSTQNYTVVVRVAARSAKAITAYAFRLAHNPGLGTDIPAAISGTQITAVVPLGTSVTALVASFTTTGAAVAVAGIPQISDTTANNFTSSVAYTVTALDGSTQIYTVTVVVASRTAKDITSFAFLAANNPGLATDVIALRDGLDIIPVVPHGTNVTALIATFTTTGASVAVAGTVQISGTTVNNFTNPVMYTVTAIDGSTQTYRVSVVSAQ